MGLFTDSWMDNTCTVYSRFLVRKHNVAKVVALDNDYPLNHPLDSVRKGTLLKP